MEKLPNEVVRIILRSLGKKDLLSARLMNRTWQIFCENNLKNFSFTINKQKDIISLLNVLLWRKATTNLSVPLINFHFEISAIAVEIKVLKQFFAEFGDIIQSFKFPSGFYWYSRRGLNVAIYLLQNLYNVKQLQFQDIQFQELESKVIVSFPYLRILEFSYIKNVNNVQRILNVSPKLKMIKFEKMTNRDEIDWVVLLQQLSERNIKVTLEHLEISNNTFSIEEYGEMLNIPLKLSIISLTVATGQIADVAKLQKFIQYVLQYSIETLRHITIDISKRDKEIEISLPKLVNLESLSFYGYLDLLKIVSKVNHKTLPSLKKLTMHLCIKYEIEETNPFPSNFLNTFTNETLKIEQLVLKTRTGTMDSTNLVKNINKLIVSKANSLKYLKIEDWSSKHVQYIKYPRMEYLETLDLKFKLTGKVGAKHINLHPTYFPNLKVLNINQPISPSMCTTELMESVQTLSVLTETISDFRYKFSRFQSPVFQFPNVRKLYIEGKVTNQLAYIFQHLTGIEELNIGIKEKVSWKSLTAAPEIKYFFRKNSVIPSGANLGNLKALKHLTFKCYRGIYQHEAVKAVAYLINNGKLGNLKYFKANVNFRDSDEFEPFIFYLKYHIHKVVFCQE